MKKKQTLIEQLVEKAEANAHNLGYMHWERCIDMVRQCDEDGNKNNLNLKK